MIAYVSGILVSKGDDSVVIDNQGIGYRVYCPYPHKLILHENALLYTYYHVREDAMLLYGFLSNEELEVFMKLITVKGVGPRIGMGVLKRVPYTEFVRAIEHENIAFLKSLPGVGPKMASQIVLDLKGKFVSSTDDKTDGTVSKDLETVYSALGDLGFKRSEIKSIEKQLLASESSDVDQLIKQALRLLAR